MEDTAHRHGDHSSRYPVHVDGDSMSVNGVVYCHLCPLKEFCLHARTDDAYAWSMSNFAKAVHDEEYWAAKCNYDKLKQATTACPLRVLLR